MSEKCQYCGGNLIIGQMADKREVLFFPEGELSEFKPKKVKLYVHVAINAVLYRT